MNNKLWQKITVVLLALLFAADIVSAQTNDSIVSWEADVAGLSVLSPSDIPARGGTFWLVSSNNLVGAPFPCAPPGVEADNTYALPNGTYLVDGTAGGTGVSGPQMVKQMNAVSNLIVQAQAQATAMASRAMGMRTMDLSGPPSPGGGGDDGTNDYSPSDVTYTPPNYGTNLFISQWSIVSNKLVGVASNTLSVQYEYLTNSDLTTTNWRHTGIFTLGSSTTNWTLLNPFPASSANTNLFFKLLSQQSSDNSGIPDWWEAEYGLTTVNPNALDGAGDGWSIYQKYALGVNPNSFYQPAAPQGLTVKYNATSGTANLSWQPSAGNVTGYTVTDSDGHTFNVSANTTTLTVSVTDQPDLNAYDNIPTTYRVQADYADGNSVPSAAVPLAKVNFSGVIIPGAQGVPQLMVSALPTNTTSVRLTEIGFSIPSFYSPVWMTNFDVPIGNFTNNLATLPNLQVINLDPYYNEQYVWVGQPMGADGSLGANIPLANAFVDTANQNYETNWLVPPFYDGRVQLKQNLIFQLQAAGISTVFQYTLFDTNGNYAGISTNPTNYAFADIYDARIFGDNTEFYTQTLNPLRPFEDNNWDRNFVFTVADVDADGNLTTGVTTGDYYTYVSEPVTYQFHGDQTALLPPADAIWLLYSGYVLDGLITADDSSSTLTLNTGFRNWFGLPYVSANVAYQNYDANGNMLGLATNLLVAGVAQSFSTNNYGIIGEYNDTAIYPQTAPPQFQTVEYDFWQPTGFYEAGSSPNNYALPGNGYFSPTNGSEQPLIAAVGSSMTIAGYAKLAVQNGYSGVYAYLGQYFDQAYALDANGIVTTNTVVVSPYGNFFATQPGDAALVTMPDVDTGARGTGVVHCISLGLDKNHDGIMDLSFSGPDNTSQGSPFVFWCNNNFDRNVRDADDGVFYDDDVQIQGCPYTLNTPTPDDNFLNGAGQRVIPCARDLQDFFRLWVCGITPSLLTNLPAGSTITLNWGDAGSPNSSNPTIDIFTAADSDGGTSYLTNGVTSEIQVVAGICPYLGRLGPGQSLQLNASQFANNWAGNYFIACGVSNGTGGLNLTIKDGGGNVLAQTTAYIQIMDIKQMYERWTVGDNIANAPLTNALSATEGLPVGAPAFQYPASTDTSTPYILFVHGWNMEPWLKDRFAETAYKRLYWQGYQGRFGVFRWPTDYDFNGSLMDALFQPHNYDGSENTAWQSAVGLLNKLNDLNSQYPSRVYVLTHSMGNVVTGEALRLAAQNGSGQIVNTYVASQAAIPAHVYDASVTSPYLIDFTHTSSKIPNYLNWQTLASYGPTTPNIYGNRLTNNIAAVGHRVNFYNVNDYALSRDSWCFDQELKPDAGIGGNYAYTGSTNDAAPWNNFEFIFSSDTPTTYFDIVNNLHDRYEVLAYASEPRSTALGATPISTFGSVNLADPDNHIWPTDASGHNYADHFWHSAQFRGDYWQQQGYWSELLGNGAFNLK